eukprot:jgi/Chlat1/8565/Chrsp82S07960
MATPADLEAAAAKLLVFGFDGAGTTVNDHAKRMISRGASGAILFKRNFENHKQVSELCAALKREAGGRQLLVMVDQEGGRVARLGAPFTTIPAARIVGALGHASDAAVAGHVLGRELRAANIDVDLAPVVDIHTNPKNPVIGDRAFGSQPDVVADMGAAFIKAIQSEGVAACAKHFPGHGDTSQDSHLVLPTLSHDLERLRTVELRPFQAAVAANVAAVMASHVAVPVLELGGPEDTGRPASMSQGAISVLRKGMKYNGVIMTDDLEMGAITNHHSVDEAVIAGLQAGIDMFLVCHTEDKQNEAIAAIMDAVRTGKIAYSKVLEAGRRVDRMMTNYARQPLTDAVATDRLQLIGCRQHQEAVAKILQREMPPLTMLHHQRQPQLPVRRKLLTGKKGSEVAARLLEPIAATDDEWYLKPKQSAAQDENSTLSACNLPETAVLIREVSPACQRPVDTVPTTKGQLDAQNIECAEALSAVAELPHFSPSESLPNMPTSKLESRCEAPCAVPHVYARCREEACER